MSGRFEEIVNQLLGGLETATGRGFLQRFVEQIAALFGADSAVIARLDGDDDNRLRTLAFYRAGRIADERLWPLAQSPNAEVIEGNAPCIFRSHVGDRFPADEVLRDTGAACYVGVPLFDSDGASLGTIALMDRNAIADDELAADILQLFSDRVAAEVERLSNDDRQQRQRQALESRLRRCSDDLATTRHELEAFAHGVSHDLRGPLRAIDGFSDILLSDWADRLDQSAVNYLHRIRSNARQMDTLLQALLVLSRVTRHRLRRSQVNLSNLCDRSFQRLQRQEPQRRAGIHIEPGMQALCDPDMLAIVLDQLIDNAWKFSAGSDPAQIEFSSERRDDATVYRIADNGAGFDMAYVDKAFELFQRLHGQQEFPGAGAGLATVKRIVERHGGRIWADAAPGRGASFYFTLPPQADDEAGSPALNAAD